MDKTTAIDMPSVETILERNTETLSYGSDIERLVRHWASAIGGQSKNAYGVNLAWQLKVYDLLRLPGAPPMLAGMAAMVFKSFLDDTFSDMPEFRAAVQDVLSEVGAA